MRRSIIIVGGNSRLAAEIIEFAKKRDLFHEYVLLSRQVKSLKKMGDEVFRCETTSILKGPIHALGDVLQSLDDTFISVIFSATFSAAHEYVRPTVVQQSLASVVSQIPAVSTKWNRHFFFIGSNLAMVPFIKRSKYKYIKHIELLTYDRIYINSEKNFFVLTPPFKPANSLLANAVGMERTAFVEELIGYILKPCRGDGYVVFGGKFSKALTKLCLFFFKIRRLSR